MLLLLKLWTEDKKRSDLYTQHSDSNKKKKLERRSGREKDENNMNTNDKTIII